MRPPKRIKLRGVWYKVTYADDLKNEDDEPLDGTCCFKTKTITLDSSLRGKAREQTFLHECGHGIMKEMHLDQVLKSGTEEIVTEAWSQFVSTNFYLRERKVK